MPPSSQGGQDMSEARLASGTTSSSRRRVCSRNFTSKTKASQMKNRWLLLIAIFAIFHGTTVARPNDTPPLTYVWLEEGHLSGKTWQDAYRKLLVVQRDGEKCHVLVMDSAGPHQPATFRHGVLPGGIAPLLKELDQLGLAKLPDKKRPAPGERVYGDGHEKVIIASYRQGQQKSYSFSRSYDKKRYSHLVDRIRSRAVTQEAITDQQFADAPALLRAPLQRTPSLGI